MATWIHLMLPHVAGSTAGLFHFLFPSRLLIFFGCPSWTSSQSHALGSHLSSGPFGVSAHAFLAQVLSHNLSFFSLFFSWHPCLFLLGLFAFLCLLGLFAQAFLSKVFSHLLTQLQALHLFAQVFSICWGDHSHLC